MMSAKKTIIVSLSLCASLFLAGAVRAEPDAAPKMKQLGIVGIGATKSTRASAAKQEQEQLLDRFLESLDQQLIDAFHNTRKFAVIARGDLKHILEEQRIPVGGIIDTADPKAANPGKVKGADYLLVATVDDFVNSSTGTYVEGMGTVVGKRYARVSVVLKIYDSTTGRLLQSVALPVKHEIKASERVSSGDYTTTPKARNDSIIVALANDVALRAAMRVVDVVFPAKIISLTDDAATISRGEGTGIARDEIWEVFALGNDMKDPDTGESLGREEVKVGELQITDVLPKFSKAKVRGENRGIDVGAIVRPKNVPQQQTTDR